MTKDQIAKLEPIYLRLEPAFSSVAFKQYKHKTIINADIELSFILSIHKRVLRKRKDGSYPKSSDGDIVAYNEPHAVTEVWRWYWWSSNYSRLLKLSFIWCSYWDDKVPRRRIVWIPSLL